MGQEILHPVPQGQLMLLGPWWVLSPRLSPHFLLDVPTQVPLASHTLRVPLNLSPVSTMALPTLSLLTATPGPELEAQGHCHLSLLNTPQH